MADIFFSYSRQDQTLAEPIIAALEAEGWSVWWDRQITAGEEFDSLTARELAAAPAAVVLWTPRSVASRWVKGEARAAADRNALVPIRFENAELPLDVRSIQTIDLDDWRGDAQSAVFRTLCKALDAKAQRANETGRGRAGDGTGAGARICVLPFANMSGDPEQEYFSDGISEDIITDLSKVSALAVTARNTAFAFKGRNVDVALIARQLAVSHILEGSVRKSGQRVRITAQLIDGVSGNHLWAERYDRDLNDIFALQDEISQAIVGALKLKLLPEEKEAIEQRDTTSLDAYNLFLMARQYMVTGCLGDARRSEAIIRLCRRATEIDPDYARAWALIAVAQMHLRFFAGGTGDNGLAAAERALALNGALAEAHAAKGVVLTFEADYDGAQREIEAALRLAPDSFEANVAAARQSYALRRFDDSIRYLEKAAATVDSDYWSVGMLQSAYEFVRDKEGQRSAAQRTLERTQKIIAQDPNNGSAMGYAIGALAALGEAARAKEMIDRALLLDPDNGNMRYNMACATLSLLKDVNGALDLLEPLFRDVISQQLLNWSKTDPDFDGIREHPRFKALMAAAQARLAPAQSSAV